MKITNHFSFSDEKNLIYKLMQEYEKTGSFARPTQNITEQENSIDKLMREAGYLVRPRENLTTHYGKHGM